MAIPAEKMVQKLGKQKFTEMATRSQPKQTGAWLERQRRWGRATQRYCSKCSIWVTPKTGCKCAPVSCDGGRHFEPYFNSGLGYFIESKGEERRLAKTLGLRSAA